MKNVRILSVFLALILVLSSVAVVTVSAADTLAEGGTVYVSGSGNNANDGLTESTPVADITTATKIIADANVTAATIKIMGEFSTPTDANTTETAHPNTTITYTGNDAEAVFTFGRHFTIGGPVIFKDLKISCADVNRYLYYNNYKLVMDTGLTMTDTVAKLQITAGYGSIAQIDNVDVTINSGKYLLLTTMDLNTSTVNGDVNVVINSLDAANSTAITTFYVGGSATADSQTHIVKGKTNVTVNDGSITSIYIGEGKANSICTFEDVVTLKINGGQLGSNGKFGRNGNDYNTTFAKGCVVDFSAYDNQGDPEDGANFKLASKWKAMLKATIDSDAEYAANYTITDASVVGVQKSLDGSSVRILVGLRDYTDVTAKINVVATWVENGETKTMTFDTTIKNVYTSVIATIDGIPTPVSAESVEANYLMSLTINQIPANLGEVTFVVTPSINGELAPAYTYVYTAA